MAADIKIYVLPRCPYCIKLINWLDTWGLSYERIDYTDMISKQKFYQDNGVNTLPQLFVNGKRIGGWTDLNASDFKKKVEAGEDITGY